MVAPPPKKTMIFIDSVMTDVLVALFHRCEGFWAHGYYSDSAVIDAAQQKPILPCHGHVAGMQQGSRKTNQPMRGEPNLMPTRRRATPFSDHRCSNSLAGPKIPKIPKISLTIDAPIP